MSTFYTNKRDNSVLKALQRRGFSLFVKYQDNDSFNEVTGEVTDGTDLKYAVSGLFLDSKVERQNPLESAKDTSLVQPTRKLMISATGLPKDPTTADVVEIDKVEWVILEITPFRPGNVVLFYDLIITQ